MSSNVELLLTQSGFNDINKLRSNFISTPRYEQECTTTTDQVCTQVPEQQCTTVNEQVRLNWEINAEIMELLVF